MDSLEAYFPGNGAWEHFVEAISPSWESCSIQNELLSSVAGDLGLAKAIHWNLERESLAWLDRPVKALESETPRRCLESETGILCLKAALMRMS